MSLIKKIEDAETKDQLEALGKEIGVEVNKRQGVETVRAELMEIAEAQASDDTGETDPKTHADAQLAKVEQGDKDAPAAAETGYKGRLLKHRKNGRLFPWTAALAKKRDMQEV